MCPSLKTILSPKKCTFSCTTVKAEICLLIYQTNFAPVVCSVYHHLPFIILVLAHLALTSKFNRPYSVLKDCIFTSLMSLPCPVLISLPRTTSQHYSLLLNPSFSFYQYIAAVLCTIQCILYNVSKCYIVLLA
jgi:hypothetical protein